MKIALLLLLAAAYLQAAVAAEEFDAYAETDYLLKTLRETEGKASALGMNWGFKHLNKPQIVFLGDSITAFGFVDGGPDAEQFHFGPGFRGWAVLLNETLGHQAALVNAAKGGSSTKGLNSTLPFLLEQLKPFARDVALVNIACGANDAVLPHSPGWHQPLPKYVQVLADAVEGLRAIGIDNIMLMTPPPVGIRHPTGTDRMNNFTVHYARAVQRLGADLHVPVADIYDGLMVQDDWMKTTLHTDNLHLSTLGNKVVHEVFVEALHSHFPHISLVQEAAPAMIFLEKGAHAMTAPDQPEPILSVDSSACRCSRE